MKHALLPALLALAFTGCIENRTDSPLRMLGSYVVTPDCALDLTTQLGQGSLDLAGARQLGDAAPLNVRYLALFDVRNEMNATPVRQGDTELASAARNTATLTKMKLSYKTTPNVVIRPEEIAVSFTLPATGGAGGQPTSGMILNLVGPNAAQALLDNVVAGDTLAMTVTAELSGRLYSGGTIDSNIRSYTIQVYDTGRVCRSGTELELNGPCGTIGGQDAYPVNCIVPDAGTL
ncbi:MAG: hypothetical protein RL653_2304 [Pseudomonadota bacterium]|jgi:hypothetical protein